MVLLIGYICKLFPSLCSIPRWGEEGRRQEKACKYAHNSPSTTRPVKPLSLSLPLQWWHIGNWSSKPAMFQFHISYHILPANPHQTAASSPNNYLKIHNFMNTQPFDLTPSYYYKSAYPFLILQALMNIDHDFSNTKTHYSRQTKWCIMCKLSYNVAKYACSLYCSCWFIITNV